MKNLNTILPFYDALTEQYRYREDCDVQPCLVVTNTALIPWVIRRSHSDGTVGDLTIQLYTLDNAAFGAAIPTTGCSITSGTSYDHIIHIMTAMTAITAGSYYMVVTDGKPSPDKLWYSETFTVATSVADLLKFQMSNTTELSNIPAGFVQIAYFNSVLKTPEYLREDTGDKRDGLLVKEKQVLMKSYTMRQIVATEYLVDALMLAPLMDDVRVIVQSGEVLVFNECRIKDPEWSAEALGSRAKIELQLIKDVVVKKLNFKETGYSDPGGNMAEIRQGYGFTVADGGDFKLVVVFDKPVSSSLYSPGFYSQARHAPTEVQWPKVVDGTQTVDGFTVKTDIESFVAWTVILV